MQPAAHPERLPRLQCKSHGFLGRTEEAVSKVGFRLMCVCVSGGGDSTYKQESVDKASLWRKLPHDLWKDSSDRHSACHLKRS